MDSKRTLGVLLTGGLAVSGLAVAPTACARAVSPASAVALPAATATPTAKATTTPTPTRVTLTVPSGSATNRGGIVTVAGTGFVPNETVTLALSGGTTTVTAKADAKGMLPATGVSIPYSAAAGAHTITATGGTSKRTATAPITVQALTPSISLGAATAAPGATETVTGKGFGSVEQVTLSLNGEAISTTAPISTSNGAFSAQFKVPTSLLRGVNTVSAIGNESRVSAVANLTGNLARATQFYMAGGINDGANSSNVDILNTNAQPASVRLFFYFENGARIARTVNVPAHASRRFVGTTLGIARGTFGVEVRADRQITAELTVNRYNGSDGDTLPGTPGLGNSWYLAAGSTNGGTETVSVLNTDGARTAHVQMQLVGVSGRARRSFVVSVPAHTNAVFNLNQYAPNQAVSVVALSDVPVLVERTQTFGQGGNSGLTTRAGAVAPATEWLFAAGTTANGVQTLYTVLNPGDVPATVTASFYATGGGTLGSRTVAVGPRSRATINLADVAQGDRIAAVVTSNTPVVVERAEYTGSYTSAKSGSVVFGRNGTGVRWTFPAGDTATNPQRDEALVLFNPSAVTVPVTATFYDSTGKTVTRQLTIAPTAHTEISVNTLGLAPQHGAVLQAGGSQGFIAEQGITTVDARMFRSTQGIAQ